MSSVSVSDCLWVFLRFDRPAITQGEQEDDRGMTEGEQEDDRRMTIFFHFLFDR